MAAIRRSLVRTVLASAALACAMSSLAATRAVAATEIGSTFDPGTSFCGNFLLQSVSPPADTYAAPFAGVITGWSYQASTGGVQLKLKVGRAAGGNNFLIVGESAVQTAAAGQLNSFPTRISVLIGDVIGLTPVTNGLPCIRGMATGYAYSAYVMGNDVPPGSTATFNPSSAGSDVQVDIAAALEADVDKDGFGDETQDQCLAFAGTSNGCPSNAFSFAKLKRNKAKGTATLAVDLPGPGELALTGKGIVRQRPGAAAASRTAGRKIDSAGTVTLKIKSKGKKKGKLKRTGKVKVKAKVTYTPTGGKPRTNSKRITLVKQN